VELHRAATDLLARVAQVTSLAAINRPLVDGAANKPLKYNTHKTIFQEHEWQILKNQNIYT
jgi:hypothetical protein